MSVVLVSGVMVVVGGWRVGWTTVDIGVPGTELAGWVRFVEPDVKVVVDWHPRFVARHRTIEGMAEQGWVDPNLWSASGWKFLVGAYSKMSGFVGTTTPSALLTGLIQ